MLGLSGDSESNKRQKAAINNLHANPNKIKDLKCVNVARHHCPLNQLKYFYGEGIKHQIFNSLPYREIIKISYAVERSISVKFCNVPNYLIDLIQNLAGTLFLH